MPPKRLTWVHIGLPRGLVKSALPQMSGDFPSGTECFNLQKDKMGFIAELFLRKHIEMSVDEYFLGKDDNNTSIWYQCLWRKTCFFMNDLFSWDSRDSERLCVWGVSDWQLLQKQQKSYFMPLKNVWSYSGWYSVNIICTFSGNMGGGGFANLRYLQVKQRPH